MKQFVTWLHFLGMNSTDNAVFQCQGSDTPLLDLAQTHSFWFFFLTDEEASNQVSKVN